MSETRLIEALVYNLWSACVCGNPSPHQRALRERMEAAQIGDLVLEMSTIHDPTRGGRVGRLDRIADEPMYTAEEWREDGPIPTDRYYYVALPDGTTARWWNCHFIAIPTNLVTYHEPFASDPTVLLSAPRAATTEGGNQ